MQASAVRGKIDKLGHARFQRSRARPKKKQKERVWNHRPKIEMRSVQLPVNHNAQCDETDNDCGCHHSMPESRARQSFCSAVVLGHRLQQNAPPKISVNLDVPFVPTGIDRIAPAFFLEELKDLPEQMVTLPPFITP